MALPVLFWSSSTSTTPALEIPINKVISIEKFQVGTDPNDASKQEVSLLITMDLSNPQRTYKLVYHGANTAASIVLRDASLAAIKAIVNQTTV